MSDKKVALVTGGGTGIGSAICRALAAEGFRVAIHYRSSEAGAVALAKELDDAFTIQGDLSDSSSIDAMVKTLKAEAGRCDVLVNNAGFNVNAPMITMKLADYDAVAAVERGAWYLTKMIVRRFMFRAESGRIVNISSIVGHTGNAGQVPYTMAKAGLDAMTKSMALEMQDRGILVNSVAPGFIDTEMTEVLPEEIKESILSKIPLGRMGKAEEIAEVVTFLATKAGYITGTVLHVNGGMYGG
jgi:3-oxoacyl-[acyl-carrier protein] reductase